MIPVEMALAACYREWHRIAQDDLGRVPVDRAEVRALLKEIRTLERLVAHPDGIYEQVRQEVRPCT